MRPASTATEVLIAVEWMLTHIGWTQFTFFRDNERAPTSRNDTGLSSMCLAGALGLVVCESTQVYYDARKRLIAATGTGMISSFNDAPGRTKEEVLAVVQKAIEMGIEFEST